MGRRAPVSVVIKQNGDIRASGPCKLPGRGVLARQLLTDLFVIHIVRLSRDREPIQLNRHSPAASLS